MGLFEVLGITIVNFISTYAIRCHIVNKNIDDFWKIAEKYNFPEEFGMHMEKEFDEKPKWYDYIPVLNVGLALKDWILRKRYMELFEDDVKHFEYEYGSVEQLAANSWEKESPEEKKYREYFVGYFLDDRPVVIYFSYDGDTNVVISNDSAPSFMELDEQVRVDTLMSILYSIYIGSREYIRCSSISEVFTESMVETLVNTFERENTGYKLEKNCVRDLVRRKPK